jgi:heme o synthase
MIGAPPGRRFAHGWSMQQLSPGSMSLVSEGAQFAGSRAVSARHEPSIASVGDYLALMKPRVMSLVVFTALVGLMIAPGHIHPVIGFTALLCVAVGAGAAGALNMWYDADIDAVMTRTLNRPIPRGRVAPGEAFAFGMVLAGFSVVVLGLLVSWLAAALLAFTVFFYIVVYTVWLKRSTPQNIVIGGAAGAFPPMIGWAAVTGNISVEPCLLFLIVFFWTPPHFWALSLTRADDYARARVPMLPVVAGAEETRRQILLYSIALVPIGASPWLLGYAGAIYGVTALVAGAVMVALAERVRRERDSELGERAAQQLFAFSIVYLFVLFAVLLVEGGLGSLVERWI